MALRQKVCQFMPTLVGPMEDSAAVPRMRAPVEVGFRGGADLSEVVKVIGTNKRVVVNAAVGAGKSTVLPGELAVKLDVLVLHVVPNEYLADDLVTYLAAVGRPVTLLCTVDQEYPDTGVVVMSASTLVARWLSSGVVSVPPCVLFHDECHESDAYTHIVRTLALKCADLRSYVAASGTHGGAGFRAQETPAKLVRKVLPAEVMESVWDLDDISMPWAVANIQDNVLIVEDDPIRARDLVDQYARAGFCAYRLHSRMSIEAFRSAMRTVRDPDGSITVLVADCMFRTGFTFPVSRVIDSGKVRECVVEGAVLRWAMRPMYESEKHQTAGRGARVAGHDAVYYSPDLKSPARVCELVAVEAEAAALIYRLLGFLVPTELSQAVMATGGVPRNLVVALQGSTPLAVLKSDDKVDIHAFFTPQGRKSPYLRDDVEVNPSPMDMHPGVSADTARRYGMGGLVRTPSPPVLAPQPLRPVKVRDSHDEYDRDAVLARGARAGSYYPEKRDSGYGEQVGVQEYADSLQAMLAYDDPVETVEIGTYYYAVGTVTSDVVSPAFPDGADSVLRFLTKDRSEALHLGLSAYNRSVAVSALVVRYNVRTCEFRVLTSAIPEARKKGAGKDRGALRLWATTLTERVSTVLADIKLLVEMMERLTNQFCSLAVMQPMREEESLGYSRVMRELDALPGATVGPTKEHMDALRSEWASSKFADTDGGVARVAEPGASEWVHADSKLQTVRMPTAGKGMRAIRGSNNPFLWLAGGSSSSRVVHRDKPKIQFER